MSLLQRFGPALLALQLALGSRGESADQSGAVELLQDLPMGQPLLWVLAAGFAGLALWQGTEANGGWHGGREEAGVSGVGGPEGHAVCEPATLGDGAIGQVGEGEGMGREEGGGWRCGGGGVAVEADVKMGVALGGHAAFDPAKGL